MFWLTLPAKSYQNLKIAGFLNLFFFSKQQKNLDREYPNFGFITKKCKKITKNLV